MERLPKDFLCTAKPFQYIFLAFLVHIYIYIKDISVYVFQRSKEVSGILVFKE